MGDENADSDSLCGDEASDADAAERIAIVIPLLDVVAEVLRNDSAAFPVCRYLDEVRLVYFVCTLYHN